MKVNLGQKDRRDASYERILWLHERIKSGSYPNASRLVEKFGISLTQAHRDVKQLKALGAPAVFDKVRAGFRYGGEYELPDSFREDDTENSLQAIALAEEALGGSVQMRIPYTAEIELDSKVSALELGSYIVGRNSKKGTFICEFRNPDLFAGMLVACGQRVRVVSPDWFREKLIGRCEALIETNK